MFFLGSIAEFVGYVLCVLNDKFDRKRMMIIFYGLVGVMCLSVVFVPQNSNEGTTFAWNNVIIIVCASVGKAMASAAINSLYIYTSQSYPTGVRVTLLLFVSSIGRLGE